MPVIAVDGGGTRCRFAVMDARGSQLAYLETATCHPGQIGLEAMGERLSAGARRVCAEADVSLADCVVSLGLAGYGPGRQRPLDQAVRQGLGDARSLLVISDAEAARLGALEGAEGLLLVAGTGSICTGVIDGAWVRAGGWGFMLGDEGSGAWLGKAAASYVLRAADGGAEKDQPLEDRLCEALDIQKPQDLVERLAQAADARRLLGTLAPVVMGLASEIYTLSLHDALPIWRRWSPAACARLSPNRAWPAPTQGAFSRQGHCCWSPSRPGWTSACAWWPHATARSMGPGSTPG